MLIQTDSKRQGKQADPEERHTHTQNGREGARKNEKRERENGSVRERKEKKESEK